MTDLEKALAKIEEGAGELREFDKCAAREIDDIVASLRKEYTSESDSTRDAMERDLAGRSAA